MSRSVSSASSSGSSTPRSTTESMSNREQDSQNNAESEAQLPKANLPMMETEPRVHGLEFLEEHLTDYVQKYIVNASKDQRWKYTDEQLEHLVQYIADCGKAHNPEGNPWRIRYNYEMETNLLHLFLGVSDNAYCPTDPLWEPKLRCVYIDIHDIENPRIMGSQYDQIIYNEQAVMWLMNNNIPWEMVEVQEAIDGTQIILFRHHDIDFTTTRKCLDAADSLWNSQKSHLEMFQEVVGQRIQGLKDNLMYSFALVHPDSENIVPLKSRERNGNVYLLDVREKYSLKSVPFSATDLPDIQVPRASTFKFENWNNFVHALADADTAIAKSGELHTEGFVLKVFWDTEHTKLRKVLKIQTRLYRQIKGIRPNTGNRTELLLDLFLQDQLNNFQNLTKGVVTEASKLMIRRAFKHLVEEMTSAYHITRGHKHPILYQALRGTWKACLYDLHGIYLGEIMRDKDKKSSFMITESVVEQHLRTMPRKDVALLMADRTAIVNWLQNQLYQKKIYNTRPFTPHEASEEISKRLAKELKRPLQVDSNSTNEEDVMKHPSRSFNKRPLQEEIQDHNPKNHSHRAVSSKVSSDSEDGKMHGSMNEEISDSESNSSSSSDDKKSKLASHASSSSRRIPMGKKVAAAKSS
jgi:plasmid maintenance system killer protein